jgi:transposase
MKQFIGCDAHKKFSVFVAMNEKGEYGKPVRVTHDRELMRAFLREDLPPESEIALETSGSYYWLVEEMERAGHRPRLAHALRAKRRMEGRNKTDTKDAGGLAMLLRNGTLPTVWIPPAELRDQREMLRLRMCLTRMRTQMKNRIHGVLMQYNVAIQATDLYGAQGRQELGRRLEELPAHSQASVREQLVTVDFLQMEIDKVEEKLQEMLSASVERDLLDSLPAVGKILSAVLALEIGDVRRFRDASHLASYAGLVPAARESAGRKRKSQCPKDCNVYLKWAFVEAGNVVATQQGNWSDRHVVQLYQRVKQKTKMHGKATVAVGRHLAEAAYWMLTKQEIYREPNRREPNQQGEPNQQALSSTHG